jgi:hypothetical protein
MPSLYKTETQQKNIAVKNYFLAEIEQACRGPLIWFHEIRGRRKKKVPGSESVHQQSCLAFH